jgi:hypothetical protein
MATANTVQSADYALKQGYYGREVQAVFERDFPTLAMIKKKMANGNPHKIPLTTSDGAGVASDYVSAAATATGVSGAPFLVELADFIGVVPLNHKLLLTAQKDGTFFDWLFKENDAKIRAIARHISTLLFGNGGGSIGVNSTTTSNVITLTDKNQAMNFWPGQRLVASANDGTLVGHVLRTGAPGYVTVQSVDRDAGTVTVDATSQITSYSNGDFLFLYGSFAGNVTQKLIFKGFAAWFQASAPTDTFWGVARTNRPELAGFRVPSADQAGPVIQRLRKAAIHGYSLYGSTPRLHVLHPKQWEQASISLAANGYRELKSENGQTGFKTLTLTTTYGDVDIMADPHCDSLRAFLLDTDSLSIPHLSDDLISPVERDGLRLVPATNDVGFEVRYTSFCNLESDAPWRNGSVPLAAV